jgi:hypothetical protein
LETPVLRPDQMIFLHVVMVLRSNTNRKSELFSHV